jgi:hypothetical protein
MTAKHGLVTTVIGDAFEGIWSISRPTFEAYARRFSLDLLLITAAPDGHSPQHAKCAIHRYLQSYERVAFVDADVLIRDDAPSLFDVVPESHVGLFEEGQFATNRLDAMNRLLRDLGHVAPDWLNAGKYYNTGVMVVSRGHAAAFASLAPSIANYGEQTYLNYSLWLNRYPIFELDYRFNRIGLMNRFVAEPRHESFFLHYAGLHRRRVAEQMRADLEIWNSSSRARR